MVPQTRPRKRLNSSKVNLFISFTFHAAILLALFYFAAREGLLGTQLKKIAVELVQEEKPPTKPEPEPEPEPAPAETPIQETMETPAVAEVETRTPPPQAPPPATGVAPPPAAAPPAAEVPAFSFEGGRAVQTTSDPHHIYKQLVEYTFRSNWNRPTDIADRHFVAEVEVSVDSQGRISSPHWKSLSGNTRWDASVRQAVAATSVIRRAPPAGFPERVLVRFDVVEEVQESLIGQQIQ